jgi:histone H3/H4
LKAVLFRERGGDVEFDVSDEDSFSSSSLFSAFTDRHDRYRSGDFTCTFLAFAKIGKWVRCGCAGMRKQSVRRVTPESAKERHKSQLGEKALRRLLASLAVACFATAGVWANRHGRRTVWRTALTAASLTAVTVKQAVRKHDGI